MTFSFDPASPLDISKPESRKANSALRDYAMMGAGRSLSKLLQVYLSKPITEPPQTKSFETLKYWSMEYLWQDRIKLFDALQREKEDKIWLDRKRELIEKDYSVANQLRDLGQKILDEAPRFLKSTRRVIQATYDKNGVQTHAEQQIITVALDGHLLVKLLQLASDLQHTAVGDTATSKTFNIDVANLTEDQLVRIANGEDPLKVLAGK